MTCIETTLYRNEQFPLCVSIRVYVPAGARFRRSFAMDYGAYSLWAELDFLRG